MPKAAMHTDTNSHLEVLSYTSRYLGGNRLAAHVRLKLVEEALEGDLFHQGQTRKLDNGRIELLPECFDLRPSPRLILRRKVVAHPGPFQEARQHLAVSNNAKLVQ
jgi:hypothetical protein